MGTPGPKIAALVGACLALVVSTARNLEAGAGRCDLVTRASTCLDLASLDGARIRLPANTTRIPASGLVLCGVAAKRPVPTDIVYLVDNSNSMGVWGFWVDPATNDTSWFIPDCSKNASGTKVAFRSRHFGGTTGADSLQGDSLVRISGSAKPSCLEANDPYSQRAQAVRVALQYQAAFDPGAMAGVVFFNKTVKQVFPMAVLDAPGLEGLLAGTGLYATSSGTLWAPPIDTALSWLAATPATGRSKAVILVSDGEPTDESKYKALLARPGLPPIYAVYLGAASDSTPQLDHVTSTTGGAKFVVPPAYPDSLVASLRQILGTIIRPEVPDTLVVRNLTNGQVSVATSSDSIAPAAYRMRLDSLVGLDTGANQLLLSLRESGRTVSASWTVEVSDAGDPVPSGLDTLLAPRCGRESSLSLAPDVSGQGWADTVDRNILVRLNTAPLGYPSLSVRFSTAVSSDRELVGIPVPPTASPDSAWDFAASIPWAYLVPAGAEPGDLTIRAGLGWDTAFARFEMPRDRRDTAWARIPLHRTAPDTTPPPRLDVFVPHPVAEAAEAEIPADESAVTVMARKTVQDSWTPLEGATPQGMGTPEGESRFSGVVVRLNRIPDQLGMYVYDRLGVLVLHRELSGLARLQEQGLVPRTPKGDYELWLAWDGKDDRGRLASTGIYAVRVLGRIDDRGRARVVNHLKSVGFKARTKP